MDMIPFNFLKTEKVTSHVTNSLQIVYGPEKLQKKYILKGTFFI